MTRVCAKLFAVVPLRNAPVPSPPTACDATHAKVDAVAMHR